MPADDIKPWMMWGYYTSPMMYGQNAIVLNEFLDKRWSKVRNHFSHSCFSLPMLHTCKYKDKLASTIDYFH